jgi:hypothetical protein
MFRAFEMRQMAFDSFEKIEILAQIKTFFIFLRIKHYSSNKKWQMVLIIASNKRPNMLLASFH